MEQILAALLTSPDFRLLVEGVAVKVVLELLHRRSTDPEFLAKSDAAFSSLSSAKTPEETINAHRALQSLMSSS